MDTRKVEKAKRMLRSICRIRHEGFVLHGSPTRSTTLLPRKPKIEQFSNVRKARGIRETNVYATRVTHIAVLYALIPFRFHWQVNPNKEKNRRYIRVLFNGGEMRLYHQGYVHVCPDTSFTRGGLIASSKRAVKPIRTFRIETEALLYLWEKGEIRFYDRLIRPRRTLPRRSAAFHRP